MLIPFDVAKTDRSTRTHVRTRRRSIGYVLAALVAFCVVCATAEARDLPDTIAAVKPSIVGVGTMEDTRSPPAAFRGTGFAVGNGHYVATNAHVIPQVLDDSKHEYLAVFIGSGNHPDIRKAERIAADYDHDLAILKISGAALPPMVLGDSTGVREGERVAFTGFPIGSVLGLFPATHRGLIAAITPIAVPMDTSKGLDPRMIAQLRAPFSVFQLDATAYPGNSGSPLYRPDSGEVIAVVNMAFVKDSREKVLSEPSGITYAMPAKFIKVLLDRVRAP